MKIGLARNMDLGDCLEHFKTEITPPCRYLSIYPKMYIKLNNIEYCFEVK
jgi:hypothetical protein